MKKTIISSIIVLALMATVWAWGGRSGDGNATGRITGITTSESMAKVTGHTDKGSLWLAYTVYWNDGHERDYNPVKVKGKFSETLTYQPRPQGLRNVVVCLWRYRVSEKYCAKQNGGQACQYCRKNGFHMEGQIDRRSE